jgi:methionyl aminopeptidase
MIFIKTEKEIQSMRAGGKIHARVLRMVAERVAIGVNTKDLDTYAETLVRKEGALPAFKGYQPDGQDTPFPATICTSINNEIVHGIPRADRILKNGDIVSIDLGVLYEDVFLDGATTVIVGQVSPEIADFVNCAQQSMMEGIAQVRQGNTTGDIGYAIQKYINKKYGIVKGLAGHGVGRKIHEDPFIPNYGKPGQGTVLQSGMTIAIEPMITFGNPTTDINDDDWTFITRDNSYAAHFEHTVLVTENGYEILTME